MAYFEILQHLDETRPIWFVNPIVAQKLNIKQKINRRFFVVINTQ